MCLDIQGLFLSCQNIGIRLIHQPDLAQCVQTSRNQLYHSKTSESGLYTDTTQYNVPRPSRNWLYHSKTYKLGLNTDPPWLNVSRHPVIISTMQQHGENQTGIGGCSPFGWMYSHLMGLMRILMASNSVFCSILVLLGYHTDILWPD